MPHRLAACLVFVLVILSACVTVASPPTATPRPTPTPSGEMVTIDAYDGDLLIDPVNLWKSYHNRSLGLAAQVHHRNRVRLLGRGGEGVQVETSYGARGWCNYRFIKELKATPYP